MSILLFSLIIFCGALCAGFLGSLTGLGGGFVVIPLLTLVFHIDIRYAVGASLVAVIATSSGAAAAYVKEGLTNIRLGMFLEIGTTSGAVIGALLAAYTPTHIVAIVFGLVLAFSAAMSFRRQPSHITTTEKSRLARRLKLNSSYPGISGEVSYTVRHVPAGYITMTFAGILSGLLGIGSGVLKVLAMDTIMRVPFKVSTTTSNFMIGVTAAASAVIYFRRGYIDPGLCMPVVLGVLGGALVGSRLLVRSDTKWLRILFSLILTILAVEMIYNGITKNI